MMNKQDMLDMAKKAFPVEITRGEALLDAAIWTLSERFIRCMDPSFPLPDPANVPEDPWFTVVMAVTEMLLKNRHGRLYFTQNSFPFLRD